MKLMNSKNIEKIIEDKEPGDLFSFEEEETSGPCWEVKVNHYNNSLSFLINGEEKLTTHMPKKKITVSLLTHYIQFLKNDKLNELTKELKVKRNK
jgi:hypothetical protein